MYNIAIDGPAGAGKSTIAKEVSKRLGFIYVDTGAMYRAMALSCLRAGVDVTDEVAVTATTDKADVKIAYKDGSQIVLLNGEDVSTEIRKEEVGKNTSKIAVYGKVREKLTVLQKELAATNDVVMDGRDIGTSVLPNADLKIYLTASVETRAKRRYDELVAKGENPDLKVIEEDIVARDYNDSHREISPLTQAEDAILVDSSNMTIEEVVTTIIDYTKKER
ncbi:(d)CMP kinase [Eubacterium sp.]|uniref:(d)CMP kinase n=1 Tax=Eubacterium sp. TaxID=142586 RepID=UPI0025DC6FC7|nr:(d)CMP kinase [Eubacterium sp.]MCR5628265.1 (d)CMP kinase [Eubacterium sp.]